MTTGMGISSDLNFSDMTCISFITYSSFVGTCLKCNVASSLSVNAVSTPLYSASIGLFQSFCVHNNIAFAYGSHVLFMFVCVSA